MAKVTVLKVFRDKNNYAKVYNPGEVVEGFDDARIADLVKRGLVESKGGKKADADEVVDVFGSIDLSKAAKSVIEAIAEESDAKNLTLALEAENAKEKPRKTVIEAIYARITELSE